jgi:hypothetical protein
LTRPLLNPQLALLDAPSLKLPQPSYTDAEPTDDHVPTRLPRTHQTERSNR